jgi:hypothetical protein
MPDLSAAPSVLCCNNPSVLCEVRSCRDNLRSYFVGCAAQEFWCWCVATLLRAVLACGLRLSFCMPRRFENWNFFVFRSKTKKQERDLLGPFARTVLCHWTSISLPTGPPQYGPSPSEHQNAVAWKPRHSEQCFSLIMCLNVISRMNVSTITPHVFPIHIQVRDACVVPVLQVYSLLLCRFSYWCSRLMFLVSLPRSSGLIPFLHEIVAFWYPVNFYKIRHSCNCLWHIHVTPRILKSGCSKIQEDPHFELQYLSTRH